MTYFSRIRRNLILGTGAMTLAASVGAQSTFPVKPIKWVVGFPPGGGTDILARTVGAQMAEQGKLQLIIENKPGAAGMLAAESVAHSAPDGYTVLTGDVAILAFNPAIYPKIRYDALADFAPVALMARFPLIVATHPASGIRSMKQVLAEAGNAATPPSYATAGVGTPHHLAMELVIATTKANLQHVPYKGDAPALQDLAGGQVPLAVLAPSLSLPYFRSGKLIALAVSSDKRLPNLPEVPTLIELGLASAGVYAWQGMVAPKGTPAPVVSLLSNQVQESVRSAVVQQKLADLGMEPIPSNATDMHALVRKEKVFWESLIKARGIKAD